MRKLVGCCTYNLPFRISLLDVLDRSPSTFVSSGHSTKGKNVLPVLAEEEDRIRPSKRKSTDDGDAVSSKKRVKRHKDAERRKRYHVFDFVE